MIQEFLKNLWRWKCGFPEVDPTHPKLLPDLSILKQREWSPGFERYMRNRLIMGGMRYGFLNSPGKLQYDRLGDIISRAQRYRETGNDELLVDMANLCLLEFEEGQHPQKHWGASDDGQHTNTINE